MTVWLAVAVGGAIGSMLRYGIGQLTTNVLGTTPVLATFTVNVSGSFLLGIFYTLYNDRLVTSIELRVLIGVGLIGGYTTFSTFSFETIRLIESGESIKAITNILTNLLFGIGAAYLGILMGKILNL
jgi:CrcB protein